MKKRPPVKGFWSWLFGSGWGNGGNRPAATSAARASASTSRRRARVVSKLFTGPSQERARDRVVVCRVHVPVKEHCAESLLPGLTVSGAVESLAVGRR